MTFPRTLARGLRGTVNAVALRLAGRAALADLEHVGRRSGTVRHTPLRAFRTGDRIVVGLNFGPESDWLKNLQAAGHGRIRLGRRRYEVGAPRLVPAAEGVRGMPRLFGLGLRLVVRTRQCVELPILAEAPAAPRRPA